jgi:hypothetical protein
MKAKPFLQGALDGLCAVYSIVNAVQIIADIDERASKQLFGEILAYLEKSHNLSRVLTEGIGLHAIGGILRDVVGSRITRRQMPFKQYPKPSLDEFWNEIIAFLEEGNRRAVLICISGTMWDHWSIVHAISDKQIFFFDSHKLKRLNRSRCTTTRSTAARPHVLCPTHTYFLS